MVSDCLWPQVVRVLEEDRPGQVAAQTLFAVFTEVGENAIFCGLVTVHAIMEHPDWIFADLAEHRPILSIAPNVDVHEALKIMDEHAVDALPVLEQQHFVGVVIRQSILEKLLQREQALLQESYKLKQLLDFERQQVLSWSEKLQGLHEASRKLLSVLSLTSVQSDLLQTAIEALTHLLEARYGAIGILDESGQLKHFVYTGMSTEQVQKLGHFPEGKGLLGVVIQDNISLRLKDMTHDPRSIGFPAHHPPMTSLLAVPISHHGHVYGRIYLCDKQSSEEFTKNDEELAFSFAHSLSLVLDNAREMEAVKRAQQSLDYLAHFDALTDLPNRTLLTDRIQQGISHAQRNGSLVAILFLDLDNFKMVNDTLGHTLGDVLLKRVAHRITECLRGGDTAARLGGDEFIVMLHDILETQDAAKVANKILASLATPLTIDQHEIFISVSIGISIYPNNSKDMEGLLADADGAMYHAKKLGKNNYQFFTPEMNLSAQNYMKLEKYLRRALEQNELVLYYQPQVAIETGRIIGMEALIRWINPELGVVAPGDFIPLAEETGLIIPIWSLGPENSLCPSPVLAAKRTADSGGGQFVESPISSSSKSAAQSTSASGSCSEGTGGIRFTA